MKKKKDLIELTELSTCLLISLSYCQNGKMKGILYIFPFFSANKKIVCISFSEPWGQEHLGVFIGAFSTP